MPDGCGRKLDAHQGAVQGLRPGAVGDSLIPKPPSDGEVAEAREAYERHGGNYAAAARELGIPRSTLQNRVQRAVTEPPRAELPVFPDDDLPAEDILDHMERRFTKRLEYDQALKWFEIKLPNNLPVGLAGIGDPHIGSNGCNVSLLRRDVALARDTDGVLPMNMGDTADNWSARLVHLYAENDVSRQTERRLARWFLESLPWCVWLHGNHDMMNGEFSTYLKTINANTVPMVDWQAKFKLTFPNGRECRVDAAHNHKGTSIYNKLHGQKRASLWGEHADIYVAGHHHNAAVTQEEADDGRFVTLARARGYKWLDNHATVHGFPNNQYGATVLFVIDPTAGSGPEFVQPFLDMKAGCQYLTWLRAKHA